MEIKGQHTKKNDRKNRRGKHGLPGQTGGYALLTAVVFFLVGTLIVVSGVFTPVFRDIRTASELIDSKKSFALAEGGLEDVGYRIKNGDPFSSTETLNEGDTAATVNTVSAPGEKMTTAKGDTHNRIRKLEGRFIEGSGVAFNYGVQSGEGGFEIDNNAYVVGNVYSNGPVLGSNNDIFGEVVSAGPTGLIDMVHATGSAHAHTIQNSDIDQDAYYQTISNTTVGGTLYPDSDDQPTSTLPISDEQVAEWEQDAEDGGIISSPCPYEIDSDVTLGPAKITCNVEVTTNNVTITLNGTLWVVGNILFDAQGITMRIASSIGAKSVPVIADNPSDPTGSGVITTRNNMEFYGSGSGNSYVLLLSQNRAAENSIDTPAIRIENNAMGDLLLYAGHGEIELNNNTELKEVTAYRVHLKNNAVVEYESGLASSLFTTGPAGGFSIDSWGPAE